MDIAAKVFVVTGAGSGIGRQVSLLLLARGAQVAGVDRNETGLAETAALATAGDRFSLHGTDITDRELVEQLPAAVVAAHGAVDGLVNVAGVIQKFVPVMELPYEEIEKVMAVNFWGTVHTVKAFLPLLVQRPEASVLNVSSMGAYAPVPGQSMYGASKAAVALLTQALYAELRGTNVTAGVVYPGATSTNIMANSGVARDAAPSAEKQAEAAARTTSPEVAAKVVVEAIEKGRFRTTIGKDATLLDRLARLHPRFATELIAKKMADLRP